MKKDLNDLGMFHANPNTKFLHSYYLDGYNSPGGARRRWIRLDVTEDRWFAVTLREGWRELLKNRIIGIVTRLSRYI